MEKQEGEQRMQDIVSLAKRRGFIYQGSEIYGGLAGTWDYGPLGVELKNNITQDWWRTFVHGRTDIYGVDSSILMHPSVWEASGHIENFHDPLVEDVKTKKRYRADHLLEEADVSGVDAMTIEEMDAKIKEMDLKSPDGNGLGDVQQFNMMLATSVGASEATATKVYLRPETAQAIFTNFKNIVDSFHPKLPFGIAQIGKAFRNEITPRDFIFRVRELEQMEIQFFIKEEEHEEVYEQWKKDAWEWLRSLGLSEEKLSWHDHTESERAHYAKAATDIFYAFPFGNKELHGIHYRTDFDLKAHMDKSGINLEYVEDDGSKVLPHVVEASVGVGRTVLSVLSEAYTVDGDRTYLKFTPRVAPVVVAVSPLLKNKPELVTKAQEVFKSLKDEFGRVQYDDNGNIGKRYARQDEIGTPFCVVVDFDTLEGEHAGTVTVRHRDTGEQERVSIDTLQAYLNERIQ